MTETLPVGLEFYWYETKDDKNYWGQIVASLHRLAFIREELEVVSRIRDIDLALERLAYHMENYLIRTYELRERVVKQLEVLAGYKEGDLSKLKSPKKRKDVLSKLSHLDRNIVDQCLQLLSILDDDMKLRNMNTHDTYLGLGLSTGYDIYDPHDALIDVQDQESEYKKLRKILRKEITLKAQSYEEKITKIIDLTYELIKQKDFR